MSSLTIQAGGIASPAGISGPATILVRDGLIQSIRAGFGGGEGEVLNARDAVVGPGLIDLHTHGAAGGQAIDGSRTSIETMARFYASRGVTGFLASIGGAPASIEAGLRVVRDATQGGVATAGARCLGAHLEGPFISPLHAGAFIPTSIRVPDTETFRRYADLAGGTLRVMTLAPELPGATDLLAAVVARGVIPAAGHSGATAAEMSEAVDHGLTLVTHLFNAMPSLHHRDPGMVGAALVDPRVTVELIADDVHVAPLMIRLLARAKPLDEIALITDSIAAAGLSDGDYRFEEQDISVRDGEARLTAGTLAGSTVGLDAAVRNFAAFANVSWVDALSCATVVPARILGLASSKSMVAIGFDADLVAFDADRQVVWTAVGGEVVHHR